jgi:uncharacterized membrane protein
MEGNYYGIHISSGIYIVLIFIALIIFLGIWIIAERRRQKRHHRMLMAKKKKAALGLIN